MRPSPRTREIELRGEESYGWRRIDARFTLLATEAAAVAVVKGLSLERVNSW